MHLSLQCMHSQAVDLTASKLVLEPSTKLLFGASVSSADSTECISVHSMDTDVSAAHSVHPSQHSRCWQAGRLADARSMWHISLHTIC